MTTHITKERAQELLDVSKHPPCGGAATCVDREGEPACDGWTEGVSRELLALAAAVVAQTDELARLRESATDALGAAERALTARDEARAEVGRLRAIVEGGTAPPTDEDIAVHAAAGGFWQARLADGPLMHAGPRDAALLRWLRDDGALAQVWVLDATGRPCGWPTPAALASAGGAAPLDPVDALNAAVTAAILRAERLAREGADATAAYADVARYEAALSALHPADTVEGETAREGVRLAVIGCAPVGGSAESGWMLGCDVGGMRVGDPPGQWGGAGRPRPEAVTVFGRCVRAVGRARKGAAE